MADLVWNYARLQQIVNDKEQERFNLEFKPCDELRWGQGTYDHNGNEKLREDVIDELSRDISAMANAAGGTIIYGIEENHTNSTAKNLDGKPFTVADSKARSPEWLDTVIRFNISPPPSVRITTVFENDDKQKGWYYVVEIQQGVTAHQAKDKKFYERINTTRPIMEQHRIVDVINRAKGPILESRIWYKPENTFYPPDAQDYRVFQFRLEITSLNYLSADYGAFKCSVLFPLRLKLSSAQIAPYSDGTKVGHHDVLARTAVFSHDWSVHQDQGVYPGRWTHFERWRYLEILSTARIPNPLYLIKTEINAPNMPMQVRWYTITPAPDTEDRWAFTQYQNIDEMMAEKFWQTYHRG